MHEELPDEPRRTYYRIDATSPTERAWRQFAGPYQSKDEAQLAFADVKKFPMDRSYRIMKVTEERIP